MIFGDKLIENIVNNKLGQRLDQQTSWRWSTGAELWPKWGSERRGSGTSGGGCGVSYDRRACLLTEMIGRCLFLVKPGFHGTRQKPRMNRSRRLSSLPEPITETEVLYKETLDRVREEVKEKDIYIVQLEGKLRSAGETKARLTRKIADLERKNVELQLTASVSDEDVPLLPDGARSAQPRLSFEGMDTSPTASDSSHREKGWSDAVVARKWSAALESERKCERLTGLNPTQLDNFTSICVDYVKGTTDSGQKKVRVTRTEEWKVSPELQIFVALV